MWLLAVVGLFFVIYMATHVYRCALYVYASEGVVPGPYTAEMMNAGWKPAFFIPRPVAATKRS